MAMGLGGPPAGQAGDISDPPMEAVPETCGRAAHTADRVQSMFVLGLLENTDSEGAENRVRSSQARGPCMASQNSTDRGTGTASKLIVYALPHQPFAYTLQDNRVQHKTMHGY